MELTRYAETHDLVDSVDPDRDTKIIDLERFKASIAELLGENPLIVIDGHYAQDLVDEADVSKILVLRKAPWELKTVLEARNYSRDKVRENVEAEIMGVCLNESLEAFPSELVYEIDTTGRTVEETLNDAQKAVQSPHGTEYPIDWMTYSETLELLRDM